MTDVINFMRSPVPSMTTLLKEIKKTSSRPRLCSVGPADSPGPRALLAIDQAKVRMYRAHAGPDIGHVPCF